MNPLVRFAFRVLPVLPLFASVPGLAQDTGTLDSASAERAFPKRATYSPYAGRNFPVRPFFGDTHLHTSYSLDAGAFGARLGPAEAYVFAKGREVASSTGQQVKLSRALDFLVVADHSDGMGLFPMLLRGDPAIMSYPQGRRWNELIHSGHGAEAAVEISTSFGTGKMAPGLLPTPGTASYRSAWSEIIKAAEEANEPGRFTAFIGYEWTPQTGGNNLHRNVIFRDGRDRASRVEPFTVLKPFGSDNPEDLWKWMTDYEAKVGGQVLAIAHNGNLSNGRMFPLVEAFGKKIDCAYVERRARWERLYEVTQIKGDGETHPLLSKNDEFANFERWDKSNVDASEAKKPEMLEFEYARSALKNGLLLGMKLGTNPYKFGLIGSTDSHTGLATADEDNFFGKASSMEPGPERLDKVFFGNAQTGIKVMDWETSASGYAAVWATENTREALFDAMQRRETYATTGPRMVVRFFGGWDFVPADAKSRLPANAGYSKGVPTGRRPLSGSPR